MAEPLFCETHAVGIIPRGCLLCSLATATRERDEARLDFANCADVGIKLDIALAAERANNFALASQLAAAERERDLAVAHDRQPYPTAAAYEAVCAANDAKRAALEEIRDTVNDPRGIAIRALSRPSLPPDWPPLPPECTHDPSLVCLRCRDFDVTTATAPPADAATEAVREAAERLRTARRFDIEEVGKYESYRTMMVEPDGDFVEWESVTPLLAALAALDAPAPEPEGEVKP